METVILTVHLILAVLLIGVVLLQRSEGGGLGMGSGGGGVMTGRQAANALSKATWFLAIGFLITSLTLTVIAARNASGASVMDQINSVPGQATTTVPDAVPTEGTTQLPAMPDVTAPATSAPATPAPAPQGGN